MTDRIRVLHLEDDPLDAELARTTLEAGGLACELVPAGGRAGYESALAQGSFDLILCDYKLPDYDALSAVLLAREKQPGTPLIILSGSLGEEAAVECLKVGATDFVLKQRLERLVPAARRALREAEDRSRRERAEKSLRAEEEFKAAVIQNAAEGLCVCHEIQDPPYVAFTLWNQKMTEITGYTMEEINRLGWYQTVYPAPELQVRAAQRMRRMREGDDLRREEWEITRADGTKRLLSMSTSVLPCHEDARHVLAVMEDVTERGRAAERQRKTDEMLFQAQKLEAVGHLAGGVAHDFNNILGVITGYGELMRRDIGEEHPARPRLEQMLKAAERATGLTRQLLAFSRKQAMQPKVLDLHLVVRNLEKMLERLVSENVEIEVRTAPDLGAVRADPTLVEQVIMNLVVNARDAMPGGGRLTIETANADFAEAYAASHVPATAGRYVVLAVSDNGVGMDAETQKHVFEPFFTTKGADRGTGLGLATVYGIVKQSGGHVWVYSEPGHGTTFKVYLPRVDAEAGVGDAALAPAAAAGGDETVLVVEDTEALREVVREGLEERGYRVLVARNGEEALALAKAHGGEIHLLLSDVVMPRMGGPELARRLADLRPGVRVLFMSGYSDAAVTRQGVLGPGVTLLEKPFTGEALARGVRQALDGAISGKE